MKVTWPVGTIIVPTWQGNGVMELEWLGFPGKAYKKGIGRELTASNCSHCGTKGIRKEHVVHTRYWVPKGAPGLQEWWDANLAYRTCQARWSSAAVALGYIKAPNGAYDYSATNIRNMGLTEYIVMTQMEAESKRAHAEFKRLNPNIR